MRVSFVRCCAGFLLFGGIAAAADTPEDFRFEITGAAWLVDASGTIQASGTPINLVSDLGVQQQKPTFYGKLVIKPARKHRIVIEGTPFRLSGTNTLTRTVTYRGQTFTVNQTLDSKADLNYAFVGYQYDLVSRPAGHLGFSVGGAYLDAAGTILAVQTSITATKSITLGLPLAGAEFRIFPIPGHQWIDVDGGIRGMGLGSYGHYLEAGANLGVWLGRHFAVQAGYRGVNANLHEASSGGNGIDVRLKGPIFAVIGSW